MNLFDLSLRLSGFPIKKARQHLQLLQEQTPEEQLRYAAEKRTEIVNFHLKNSRFYTNFTGFSVLNNWEELPLLTKSDLQQPLPDLLSKPYSGKKVYRGKTSGSSGTPFYFAKDAWCHALSWASFYEHYAARDIDLSGDKQARFYGIPLKGTAFVKERLKDKVSNRYRFNVFDASPQALENSLNTFKTRSFCYINGYTSSILRFARFLKEKNVVLREVCATLKACISTSEVLFQEDRDLMENYLGVPVINEYGASETGLIAFENDRKQLKIDEKLLYVEVVNDHGEIVPYGEKGRILITSLYNKAQPFIRYEIGDLGVLERETATNNLFLRELSGRINDTIHLPGGKTLPGLAFYYVTKSVMEKTANVKELVVTQTALDRFEVRYVSDRELNKQEKNAVIKAMKDYLENGISLKLERVPHLQRSASGKLKQFRSQL